MYAVRVTRETAVILLSNSFLCINSLTWIDRREGTSESVAFYPDYVHHVQRKMWGGWELYSVGESSLLGSQTLMKTDAAQIDSHCHTRSMTQLLEETFGRISVIYPPDQVRVFTLTQRHPVKSKSCSTRAALELNCGLVLCPVSTHGENLHLVVNFTIWTNRTFHSTCRPILMSHI